MSLENFYKLENEKQEKILNVAMAEFVKKGLEKSSTNEIAIKANISKGFIFNYFKNKEGLYNFVLDYSLKKYTNLILDKLPKEKMDFLSLLKKSNEIKVKFGEEYSLISDFIYKAYKEKDNFSKDFDRRLVEVMDLTLEYFNKYTDKSFFKEGISVKDALDICKWVSEGATRDYVLNHENMEINELQKISEKVFSLLEKLLYK